MAKYLTKVQISTEELFTRIYSTGEKQKKKDRDLLCWPRQPLVCKELTQLGLPPAVAQALG